MNTISKISFALVLLVFGSKSLLATPKPNFVFIIADDMTFREIGCYGGQAHTPNIDRLATEGLKFNECYQAAPMCSPTRHNIYTGLYPVKSGAYPNHTFAKPETQSIVHYLKPMGYRVALSGKKHISPKSVFPFEYSGKNNNPDMNVIESLFKESKRSNTPFCLFACSNEPHAPWDKGNPDKYPPEKIKLPPYIVDTPVVREQFGKYLAEVTYFDKQVGQILKLLDQNKLRKNTLVIVVSEQGNQFPFAKWTCYGNGLQSAMIARWPRRIKPGTSTNAMVEYVDLVPTFVEAAGGVPSEVLDGKSFLPVLKGESDHHKDFSYGIMTTRGIIAGSDQYAIRTVRDKQYRLIWNLNFKEKFSNVAQQSPSFLSMIEKAEAGSERAKELVNQYYYRPEYELFDCQADPLEMNNLANEPKYKDVVNRLKEKLLAWMKEQGDQGIETELDAIIRQGKYKHMTREEAMKQFKNKGSRKKKRNKKKATS